MQPVYIIILLSIVLISAKVEKNIYNPITIFSFIWAFVFFLAGLRLYDLNAASQHAYNVAFIGVIFFVIGCLFRKKMSLKGPFNIDFKSDCKLNYAFLIAFYSIILVFTIVLAIGSFRLLLSGISMAVLRDSYDDVESGMLIKSNAIYQMENYCVTTAEFAAIALLPIVFTDGKKSIYKRILSIELIAFLVLHMFVTGARSFMIDIAILFLIYMLINGAQINKFRAYFSKIPKFIYVLIGIGAIGMVILMTRLRTGEDEPIFRQIYRYFSISMPLLDTHLKIQQDDHQFTYGWTMLYGVVRPFFSFAHSLGLPYPPKFDLAIEQVTFNNQGFSVGGGWANSFVTVFYYECMDYGLIGLPFFSMLYGITAERVYKRMMQLPNRRNQALYLLIAIGLVLSFARHFFTAFRYVYAFVIVYFSFKKSTCNSEINSIL